MIFWILLISGIWLLGSSIACLFRAILYALAALLVPFFLRGNRTGRHVEFTDGGKATFYDNDGNIVDIHNVK